VSWQPATSAFERTHKRRKGFPSETKVKRGDRVVHGDKELIRETRPQRSVPVRQREVVSRTVACATDNMMVRSAATIDVEHSAAFGPPFLRCV